MGRKILAVVVGVTVAVVIVAAIQSISSGLYPLPEGVTAEDSEAMQEHVDSLPPTALLIVLASYCLGTLGGGLAATWVSSDRQVHHAVIVTAFVLLGAVSVMFTIRQPIWFNASAVAGILAAGLVVARRPRRRE